MDTKTLRCGLLGRKLGHSYSPAIHERLADYSYRLFEVEPEDLGAFLQEGAFDGLNVTIPYKKDVIPYCAELSDTARAIGAVNTLVRRADGTLWGDNTDAYGFSMLVQSSGADVAGKKALVFGSGGASATAQYVLRRLGAREVVVISRHGEDNYENLDRHADAQIAVNTTPVGMYPNTGVSPVDLHRLPRLEAALDVVYNVILIGMPGSGKTTIGTLVAKRLGRTFVDADSALEREAGMPIPEIFRLEGEAGFRRRETAVLAELGRQSGLVLATGGGSVTREENYPLLHQNGEIFCLQRALERLPSAGRPVSQALGAQTIYAQRKPLYARFADAMIDNNGTPEAAAAQILEVLGCSC